MPYTPPPAKTEISDTYPNPSNAVARAGFGTLWEYVTGLLGLTGNPAQAQIALELEPGVDVQTYSSTLQSYANGNTLGFKNRIINGAMVIDQRNAGASVTGTASLVYNLDRYASLVNTDGVMTFQRVTDAPTGFTYSLRATTTTADASLSASQRAILLQRIEGFNSADLMLGSASAVPFTLSFWVKSTLTGTFGGAFQNNDSDRAYPFTYTISAANTWEQKTVTITGDTTGTWNTTTGTGLQICWGLGVGSTFSATAGSWQAGDFNSATGGTSVIGTLNATWQVTGVQLEKGSTATSFDYRPYGTELQLCQRYFQQYQRGISGVAQSSTTAFLCTFFPTVMRSAPSIATTGVITCTDTFAVSAVQSSASVSLSGSATSDGIQFSLPNFSGFTQGRVLQLDGANAQRIQFSAEL
jgi:hypothetical protein